MRKLIIAGIISVFALVSCEKLEEINKNPNNVSETHPQFLLTNIEWNAFQVTGASPLYAGRMIVQTDGEEVYQYYKWDRGSFDGYGRLRDVNKMIEEARRINNKSYEALGKFFRAYYFYNLTLLFGDIPYSQALKGESDGLYNPAYDSQKDVFKGILTELEEANDLITDDLIEGDIIFNKNPYKWKKLINSFRLKVLITLSKKESDTDLNVKEKFAAIAGSQPIMQSTDDNAQLIFSDQLGARYTEYNNSNYGSARYMDSTFIKRLQDRRDPRLFIYAGQTRNAKEAGLALNDFNAYEGGNPIAPYNDVNLKAAEGKVSRVNLRYTTDPTNEPHMLLGYHELQLIFAEARLRGWITSSDVKTYYNNGIKASFNFYNKYAKGYSAWMDDAAAEAYLLEVLINLDNAVSDNEKLERIIMQKYLASFLQGGWNMYFDHLRTGYPVFLTLPGVTPPTRWMYPTSEYQYNNANVTAAISSQYGPGNDKIREIPWWLK
ncbi:MAG: SusD/RagB family nutrient-binding outer membrane lipoprotein [Bacteroidales bacterium]|nr:SusD/RagB family nutrient-binding outer membrane lipoprotein [Bacteroidales bacterium]